MGYFLWGFWKYQYGLALLGMHLKIFGTLRTDRNEGVEGTTTSPGSRRWLISLQVPLFPPSLRISKTLRLSTTLISNEPSTQGSLQQSFRIHLHSSALKGTSAGRRALRFKSPEATYAYPLSYCSIVNTRLSTRNKIANSCCTNS